MHRLQLLAAAGLALIAHAAHAGPLTPPAGPPAPTYRTLDQVEPRTDIATLPGVGTDEHTITEPGSYYLTGNLTSTAPVVINVAAPDVVIDLNGFAIDAGGTAIRKTASTGTLTVRNGTIRGASGHAIDLTNAVTTRAIVDDVVVTGCGFGIEIGTGGMAARCVILQTPGFAVVGEDSARVFDTVVRAGGGIGMQRFAHVERVRLEDISSDGIFITTDGLVRDAVVFNTVGDGIETRDRCTVASSHVRDTDRAGIVTGDAGVVVGCTVTGGTFDGISVEVRSRVEGCVVEGSGFNGIEAGLGSTIIACHVVGSGSTGFNIESRSIVDRCVAIENAQDGIRADADSIVTGSIARSNGREGIDLQDGSIAIGNIASFNGTAGNFGGIRGIGDGIRIEGNTVRGNPVGIELNSTANSLVIRNYAENNTTNYSNVDQPIVSPLMLGTASPWANVAF